MWLVCSVGGEVQQSGNMALHHGRQIVSVVSQPSIVAADWTGLSVPSCPSETPGSREIGERRNSNPRDTCISRVLFSNRLSATNFYNFIIQTSNMSLRPSQLSLDPEVLANFWPVSNICFLFKIIKKGCNSVLWFSALKLWGFPVRNQIALQRRERTCQSYK